MVIDSQIVTNQRFTALYQMRNLAEREGLAMQFDHAQKGLYIAPDRRTAVTRAHHQLVIALAAQPAPDDLRFVRLPTPDTMQIPARGQIDPFLLERMTISLDGAHANVQSYGQIFLRRYPSLLQCLLQQALDSHSPQRYPTISLQNLLVFRTSIHCPTHLNTRHLAQGTAGSGLSTAQDHADLAATWLLSNRQQTCLRFGQHRFGQPRGKLKVVDQCAHEMLLDRLARLPFHDRLFHLAPPNRSLPDSLTIRVPFGTI